LWRQLLRQLWQQRLHPVEQRPGGIDNDHARRCHAPLCGIGLQAKLKKLHPLDSGADQLALQAVDALPVHHRVPERINASGEFMVGLDQLFRNPLIIRFDFVGGVNQHQSPFRGGR
tara:strand:- start:1994 stop:2341 length:348 start_codon:yes stop_codon:yes gene_type:complete